MFVNWTETLFGCRHGNYSFPITLRSGQGRSRSGRAQTYVVCLDCGRKLAYDWGRMKVLTGNPASAARAQGGIQLASSATES